jgi:RNA polymerase sigma-70 factor (ECF subfamily)
MPVTSFELFFKDNYKSFCFFASRYLNDPQLAEDIVSDVALKVWEKKDELKNAAALKNYFYTSIRNACLNHITKEKSRKERLGNNSVPLHDESILENIIRTETLRELEVAIESLPVQCRNVFIKLFREGKSLSEVAEEMGLSIFTIKAQRQRGIKLLRERLISSSLFFMLLLFF